MLDTGLMEKITPNQAPTIMQVLMTQVPMVEADELSSYLDAIEAESGSNKMTLKSQIKQLERKIRLNLPVRHAPPLISPTKEEIERAREEYHGAILTVVHIWAICEIASVLPCADNPHGYPPRN